MGEVILSDGHAWWRLDGFRRGKSSRFVLELVQTIEHGPAVNGLCGIGRDGGADEGRLQVFQVRAGDGPRLGGSRRVEGEGEHRF